MDHKNGKKHNRVLGMNMKVKKVGVDAVNQKLELLAQKKKLKKLGRDKLRNSIKIKKDKPKYERTPKRYSHSTGGTQTITPKIPETNKNVSNDFIKMIKGEIQEAQLVKNYVKENLDTHPKEEPSKPEESELDEEDYVDEEEIKRYKALGIPLSFASSKRKK
jgi:U4/U6.U5 tri-snRNP component SNU23